MSKLYKDFLLLILALLMTIFFNGCPEESLVHTQNSIKTLHKWSSIITTYCTIINFMNNKITILFPKWDIII